MVDIKKLESNIKTMYLLIVVFLLSVLFSAVMFTMSLIYDVLVSLIISSITGVLSCIGIFYTGYIINKIKETLFYIKNVDNID